MTASVRRLGSLVAAVSLSAIQSSLEASETDVARSGQTLRACYLAASAVYGLSKCDPAPMLVGAVFGKCAQDEAALRDAVRRLPPQPLIDNAALAESVVQIVRNEMTTQIQSWLVDAQRNNHNCR